MIPQQRRPNTGFTVVELLVVIGIIALLISILLPALLKARKAANSVACLSNLRQVGTGLVMYAQSNRGWLPMAALYRYHQPEDWVYWQSNRSFADSRIAPYLGIKGSPGVNAANAPGAKVLMCPEDTRVRPPLPGGFDGTYGYPFSYVMNTYAAAFNFPYVALPAAVAAPLQPRPLPLFRRSAEKAIVYEEVEFSMDDGAGDASDLLGYPMNLLTTRHDRTPPSPDVQVPGSGVVPAAALRGNVVFADGHADNVPRSVLHVRRTYLPSER